MDYEHDVDVIFHGPDFNPEIAKEAFLDAIWGAADNKVVNKNEKETQ